MTWTGKMLISINYYYYLIIIIHIFIYLTNKQSWREKIIISNDYYYYLIIIIPNTLFINKKPASYSDYFEICRSPNHKYMLCFVKIPVTADISKKFIVFFGTLR